MLDRKLDVKCPWCGKTSHLGDWNDSTYNRCTSREMKRAFTNLTDKRAFMKNSDTFYICPKCEQWSRGCQLSIVNTENKSLLSLGRQPKMMFGKSDGVKS